jgi:DUF438 domain-containing protein
MMENDQVIATRKAEELHSECMEQGVLPMWTVTWNTSDYPRKAVARLTMTIDVVLQSPYVLIADSLEELREELPAHLIKLERHPGDDPVIVEVWL